MKEEQQFYQERIVADPRILAGKPVVKGTRIGVDLVLEELAHNPDITELLAAHPDLTRDDVQACLAYAQAIVTGKDVSPTHKVAEAMDKINDRWGEFVVIPALMMGMGDIILDRISFGGVKELEEIYSD